MFPSVILARQTVGGIAIEGGKIDPTPWCAGAPRLGTGEIVGRWASREKSSRTERAKSPQPVRVNEFHFHFAREGSVQRNCREHECVTVPCRNLRTIDLTTLTIGLSPS